MAAYKLLIKTSAGKELAALGTKADRATIAEQISSLATNPGPHGSEKLAGLADGCRVRQGNYRIVYVIDGDQHEVTVFKIGDRKEAYR